MNSDDAMVGTPGHTEDEQLDAAREFVNVWVNSGLASTLISDYGCTMTCPEADAYGALLDAFGFHQTAADVIEEHAETDEPGDAHYRGEEPDAEPEFTADSPQFPCAYCGKVIPREQGPEPWIWPGKGWVTACRDCTGETDGRATIDPVTGRCIGPNDVQP